MARQAGRQQRKQIGHEEAVLNLDHVLPPLARPLEAAIVTACFLDAQRKCCPRTPD